MKSIRVHGSQIKKVYVPKYMYPLSAVLSNFVSLLLTFIVLAVFMILLEVPFTIYFLQAILPLLLLLMITVGFGLLLSSLSILLPDIEHLWGTILLWIMYISAIFYYYTDPGKIGTLWLFKMSPIFCIIENFRDAVFSRPLNQEFLFLSAIYSITVFLFGTIAFHKTQDKFILYI